MRGNCLLRPILVSLMNLQENSTTCEPDYPPLFRFNERTDLLLWM